MKGDLEVLPMRTAEALRLASPLGHPTGPGTLDDDHAPPPAAPERVTRSSLVEQLAVTEIDVVRWKALLAFDDADVDQLTRCKRTVRENVEAIVGAFYDAQTAIPEVALKIGDADTLRHMKSTMRQYVIDLFEGHYDLTYVGNRLRIGKAHQRMGIEPRLFLAAMSILEGILAAYLLSPVEAGQQEAATWLLARKNALRKLMMFDTQLVMETYILSLSQEIDAARRHAEAYAASLERAVAERTRRLEELSVTDQLTGLGNQRGLFKALHQELGRTERYGSPLSVIYLDVNDFKRVNDERGHLAGDELLHRLGETIATVVRHVDMAFRYGGDEFCILAPNTNAEGARQLCHRLIEALSQRHPEGVDLAIGITEIGASGPFSPDDVLRQADRAMYEAKRAAHRSSGCRISLCGAPAAEPDAAQPS